ncbi:MAG: hypothetical protein LBQ90_02650, partial [Synergistaceae bacterium]|nr:hypothetical protein [Synergistaceae bacterium]
RVSSHDPGGVFSKGLEQTTRYAEQSSAEEAHLVICDERPDRSWGEKIFERVERCGKREVHVWGL